MVDQNIKVNRDDLENTSKLYNESRIEFSQSRALNQQSCCLQIRFFHRNLLQRTETKIIRNTPPI